MLDSSALAGILKELLIIETIMSHKLFKNATIIVVLSPSGPEKFCNTLKCVIL